MGIWIDLDSCAATSLPVGFSVCFSQVPKNGIAESQDTACILLWMMPVKQVFKVIANIYIEVKTSA